MVLVLLELISFIFYWVFCFQDIDFVQDLFLQTVEGIQNVDTVLILIIHHVDAILSVGENLVDTETLHPFLEEEEEEGKVAGGLVEVGFLMDLEWFLVPLEVMV